MSQRYQGGFITASYNGLKVPNAPTIGTATASVASASVTFTAPVDVGGGAITGYIVRSDPGNITGTGASSPITVSGLSNGTAYTFNVFATNAFGTGPASAASNSVTPAVPAIGDAFGGGYYTGQIGVSSVATHYLVVGPKASAFFSAPPGKIWSSTQTNVTGAQSVIDGPANSAAMNSATYPAAQFCEGLTIGGYSDWYLPAKNELEICYYNLKPTTTSNNTASGINANAVPARASNYTAGSPAQTSVTTFRTTGAESFEGINYWSSTQVGSSTNYAWTGRFGNGFQDDYGDKINNSLNVRAVRRVAV